MRLSRLVPARLRPAARLAQQRLRRFRRIMVYGAQACPAILMYHRIAEPEFDPWRLSVSPANFEDQMRVLKARRSVMPLNKLVDGLREGSLPPGATAITFDDGYQDNLLCAVPILERSGMTATIFPVMGVIGSGIPFWWDDLARMVLGNPEARELDILTGTGRLRASWGRSAPDEGAWHADQPPRTLRQAAYLKIWRLLQGMNEAERGVAMQTIRRQLLPNGDVRDDTSAAIPMTGRMLAECLDRGMDLGGHGRSHVPLPTADDDAAFAEIAGGRADLAAITGKDASAFAYPHGEHDARIRTMVSSAGYAFAVDTRDDLVEPRGYDLFALPRLATGNYGGAELCSRIAALGG